MALSSEMRPAAWKYDVFLSFRGQDTRKGFTDHLHDKLRWRGIRTFRDDPQLKKGSTISTELLTAIEQSRFALVVLSDNYASSTWCLLELTKIAHCMGERGTLLPVFYGVHPSDVRQQRGSFAEAFNKHEAKFGDLDKVQEWRDALTKVANIAGWNSMDYMYETDLIKEIVEALWSNVHPTLTAFNYSEKLVGIDSGLREIDLLLDIEANDVRFIGIWGMGGIGKTTLARLVYERICYHFECCIFLANVKEVCATHGLVHVQKQILCQILKEEGTQVCNAYGGIAMIKNCFVNKAVLVVLDDVDELDQLENLVGEKDWFGLRSRIIITTRDQRLLASHDVDKSYKMKQLNEDEALQLFSWKAFKKDTPEEGYEELSKSVLDYAAGLPLALKIVGSFLYKRDKGDWKSALDMLKKAPIDQKLFKVLRISYDGLDKMHQQAFLEVACFFKGICKERVIEVLDSIFGFDTSIIISLLVEKCLLTVYKNLVDMHDLIQEMGWEIVRLESEEEPGRRSRLWLRDDIFHVFKENTGTEAIRGMVLCLPKSEDLAWNSDAFAKMPKLRILKIHNLSLSQGPKYLPDAIRSLQWSSYPSKSLPPSFHPAELIELVLHHSKIDKLWHDIKFLDKLKYLDLSYSENLIMTPDFTGIKNLERLVLEGCTNLVTIHPSIAFLRRLKVLNFKNCRSILNLPNKVEMKSLEICDLSGCSKVKILPEFVGQMKNLSKLSLSGIGIRELPSSIVLMQNLRLSFTQGSNMPLPKSRFSFLPSFLFPTKSPHPLSLVLASLKNFSSLRKLYLNDCNLGEGAIPDDIGFLSSLEDLNLSGNNFVTLPASISQLSKLYCIDLNNCKNLHQMPDFPSSSRLGVRTDNCTSLQMFPDAPGISILSEFILSSINCSSMVCNEKSNDIVCLMLRPFCQEPAPAFEFFTTVVPGNEIPVWFSNKSEGGSVTEKLTLYSSNNQCIGFAVCAVFGAEETSVAVHGKKISCIWEPAPFGSVFSFPLDQVILSDHLWVFILPRKYYPDNNKDKQVKFVFETQNMIATDPCLKVKKCGVRTLYQQDADELKQAMYRSKCSKDVLYYCGSEIGGAMCRGTHDTEAGPSGGSNSDNEYYSAEE